MPEPTDQELQKITRKGSQNHLRAYRSSHKNERDRYGINKREESELGFSTGLKTVNSTYKELNLNPFFLKVN